MKITFKKSEEGGQKAKTLALFISKESQKQFPSQLDPFKEAVGPVLKEGIFKGKKKTSFFMPFAKGFKSPTHLLLVGVGEEKSFDYEGVRSAAALSIKQLKAHGQTEMELFGESLKMKNTGDWERLAQALSEGLSMACYQCNELKKQGKEEREAQKKEIKEVFCSFPKEVAEPAQKGLRQGEILGAGVNFARKISNYPGNLMSPAILAEEVLKKTKDTKIQTEVWDKNRLKKEKMGGLLGVSLGSSEEPRFILMKYMGAQDASKKPVVLVGKGLTFDSGGISIKPSKNMHEMKFDMCGAAGVIGALLSIEKLGLKVNVVGLVPSSENMPGQSANKPGDILRARNGKTMEVLNTDAEGRLILADALSYACELKPEVIFDAATLTGAILSALGNIFTGFFTKNEELAKKVYGVSQTTGERMWRLPLVEEHRKDIKSVYANVANISSGKGAGSSTAAAFLEHFVEKEIPWVHFDIAGTAWNVDGRLEYCSPQMASGVMVRSFTELVRLYED